MIKKTIEFTDFNGEKQTTECWFHLSKRELLEMELHHPGGLAKYIKQLTEAEDSPEVYELFKKIILDSYGVRPEDDPTDFDKDDPQIRAKFARSEALSELIFEFFQVEDAAAEFVRGIMPAGEVAEAVEKAKQYQKSESGDTPEIVAGETESTKVEALEWGDFTQEELVAMPREKFEALLPKKQSDYTRGQLLIAMQRRNQEA